MPDFLNESLMYIYESDVAYYTLLKETGIDELKYFNETGKDLLITEQTAIGSFIESIIRVYRMVIRDIINLFEKFAERIKGFIDKQFSSKFGKYILAKEYDGNLKVKGHIFYEYPINKDGLKKLKFGDIKNKIIDMFPEKADVDAAICKLRGSLINESVPFEKDEFRKRIHDQIYGKEKVDITITTEKLKEDLAWLSDSGKIIKEASKQKDDALLMINYQISEMKATEAAVKLGIASYKDKNDNKIKDKDTIKVMVKNIHNIATITKTLYNDVLAYFGILLNGYKDKTMEAKVRCVKAILYKAKNEEELPKIDDSELERVKDEPFDIIPALPGA